MDNVDYGKAASIRGLAGASAVGLIAAMVECESMPPLHLARAKEIIAEWDGAIDAATTKGEATNVD